MPTVTLNTDDVNSLNASLSVIKLGSKDAIIAATNDSLSGIKTESARLVATKITPKVSKIKTHFLINKMKKIDMSADIKCSGKPLPLIDYSARSVVKGASVQVFKKNTRTIVKHAFIATMKSGHKGVFWREKRIAGKRWKVGKRRVLPSPKTGSPLVPYQLKITERYGPRVPDIFDDPDIINPTLKHASKRFDDRLDYHADRLMAKARGA